MRYVHWSLPLSRQVQDNTFLVLSITYRRTIPLFGQNAKTIWCVNIRIME